MGSSLGTPRRGGKSWLLIGGIVAAVVLIAVIIGVVALSGGGSATQKSAANPHALPKVYVPTPTNSLVGKLNDRSKDQRPLDAQEVFGGQSATLTYKQYTFKLAGSDLSGDCRTAMWGSQLQSDLQRFGCTQIARGAYVTTDQKYVGQFIAINLSSLTGSQAILHDLDPVSTAGFVSPLAAKGMEDFGGGFSAAYSQPFGHYVVISWVERAGGGQPQTMNELLDASIAVERADNFVWERLVLIGQ